MTTINCSRCGKSVSSAVPESTVVRAWVECPECIEKEMEQPNGDNVMKQSKMTDAEYATAQANVESLWQKYTSLRDAAGEASSEWVNANHDVKAEAKARDIDRLVAEAMSQQSEVNP